jgi:hypothetical protein
MNRHGFRKKGNVPGILGNGKGNGSGSGSGLGAGAGTGTGTGGTTGTGDSLGGHGGSLFEHFPRGGEPAAWYSANASAISALDATSGSPRCL